MNTSAAISKNSRPKLLILELWGLGDLAMASPFIESASAHYNVTLVAKNYALDLQRRFWPTVTVIPASLPWTAFTGKYRLHRWPWREITSLVKRLRREQFDIAVSGRWDPRDHALMWISGAKRRIGFPRTGSQLLLTKSLEQQPGAHRYENWKQLAATLNLNLPELKTRSEGNSKLVVLHSGAAQPIRVWPLDRFREIARRIRASGFPVQIVCDASQRDWWLNHGEPEAVTPTTVTALIQLFDSSSAFIGNDSGPGHLAAICGVPTFTIFGPAIPQQIAPIHPKSNWMEGKPCEYKPCRDYCRYSSPKCLEGVSEKEVWTKLNRFFDSLRTAENGVDIGQNSP